MNYLIKIKFGFALLVIDYKAFITCIDQRLISIFIDEILSPWCISPSIKHQEGVENMCYLNIEYFIIFLNKFILHHSKEL